MLDPKRFQRADGRNGEPEIKHETGSMNRNVCYRNIFARILLFQGGTRQSQEMQVQVIR